MNDFIITKSPIVNYEINIPCLNKECKGVYKAFIDGKISESIKDLTANRIQYKNTCTVCKDIQFFYHPLPITAYETSDNVIINTDSKFYDSLIPKET